MKYFSRRMLFAFVFGCFFIVGCTTTELGEYGVLETVEDPTRLNVTFRAAGTNYQRTTSEIGLSKTGWVEFGIWQSTEDANVEVSIYMATLYRQAFHKKHVRELRVVARGLSGHNKLYFGDEGTIETNTWPIEYIFYRVGSQSCVFIRKYWVEPELSGDIIMVAPALDWIAGQNFIHASDCRPGFEHLQLSDLNRLFNGMKARNVFWPDDLFVSADGVLGGKSIEASD